ncbi:phosphoribosyltransferase-like protein [Corallococcus exiguus]|uniref:phosphoribosyltransferase-like protein n=1 Tax=Corallococcus exiguus TaxID=83462 RepID=UPI003DA3CEBA
MTIDENQIIANTARKCEALKRSGLWKKEPRIRPQAWLRNFEDDDRATAALLLDRFTFFSDEVTDRLLRSAYASLIQSLAPAPTPTNSRWLKYNQLINSAYITRTEKEEPNPAESGNLFCRKARQVLRLDGEKIIDPAPAILEAAHGRPIIFIDDFIGSGEQFIKTWHRPYRKDHPKSFDDAFKVSSFNTYYVCPIATVYGALRIGNAIPQTNIHAAHTLDYKHSLHPETICETAEQSDIAKKIDLLIKKYTPRILVDDYLQRDTYPQYGFHNLALTIAFDHSVPDSTIPLFWAKGGPLWAPLIERL